MSELTHSDLVRVARRWLFQHGHGVVFSEFQYMGQKEFPDGLGFRPTLDYTVLIECKATRSDFLADAKKPFRIHPERGMGDFRWYMAPVGLLQLADLPENWGLLEVDVRGRVAETVCLDYLGRGDVETYYAIREGRFPQQFRKNAAAEQRLMYAALRRLTQRGTAWEILNTPQTHEVTWASAPQAPASAQALGGDGGRG
ncbi:hypothetical protein [Deinococcus sp. Leaf326]|uniref:hypothetical protein n=1 Tax=Deinococcus sp. Leaf326 TaxID=1736338 RepID=UPI0006FF802A|nr:hypothetical protein [Deinococcus sp. Leaf326]KQR22886.1 hypothetical protein ASF71_06885 [Deinococcus sp. Leaf326]